MDQPHPHILILGALRTTLASRDCRDHRRGTICEDTSALTSASSKCVGVSKIAFPVARVDAVPLLVDQTCARQSLQCANSTTGLHTIATYVMIMSPISYY